jgi:ribonuclease BN (tRNA processing enzyme)
MMWISCITLLQSEENWQKTLHSTAKEAATIALKAHENAHRQLS